MRLAKPAANSDDAPPPASPNQARRACHHLALARALPWSAARWSTASPRTSPAGHAAGGVPPAAGAAAVTPPTATPRTLMLVPPASTASPATRE
jgi:hypothetical protein